MKSTTSPRPRKPAAKTAASAQRFGAHMSIAGGLHEAFPRAIAAGCDCLQVFVKNQRQWNAKPLTDDDIRAWNDARKAANIEPIVAHDTYLINLAAPGDVIWKRSIDAFVEELERCEQLGIAGLVAHPGSHCGSGEDAGLARIADALDLIHRRTAGYKVRTLLEITAGQGTNLGCRFEHLATITHRVKAPERLAVCFDTCHAFAAGYELRTPDGYAATIDEFDRHLGIAAVACFHVNDSKKTLGSRVDRHERIGHGELGLDGFRHLLNDPRFAAVPRILETPKGEDENGEDLDRLNLAALRALVARQPRRKR